MADNILNPASGEVVAADEVSGVRYQIVKLASGTADSTAVIPGDATNGLAVDLKQAVGLSAAITSAVDLTTIDFGHQEIHDGDSFCYNDVLSLAANASADMVLTVPNSAKRPHLSKEFDGIFGFSVDMWEGTDRSGTATVSAYNRDRESATVAGMTLAKGTTGGTTDGTARIVWRSAGSATNQGKLAGNTTELTEWMLKRNTKYLIRIVSLANSNTISVRLNWYEHTA